MKDFLELEIRRNIYDVIAKNPGLHLSQIARMLDTRVSLIEYHLSFLEKSEIITVLKVGYSRYYLKNQMGRKDGEILSQLRQEIPLRIVLFLLNNPNSRHKEILKNVDVSKSTLSYHLNKLVKHGLIISQNHIDEKGYTILNKKEITDLLIRYKPYNVMESFKDIWGDLQVD